MSEKYIHNHGPGGESGVSNHCPFIMYALTFLVRQLAPYAGYLIQANLPNLVFAALL